MMVLRERVAEDEYGPPDWMSAGECAHRYGLHINTLYRALAAGRVPFEAHKVGGRWFIRRYDVDRVLADATPDGTAALLDGMTP